MKKALVLYPHQLYPADVLPEVDVVYVVEEPLYFGVDREVPMNLHRQKLILHRASMRRYVEEVLWPKDMQVEYVDLDVLFETGEVLEHASKMERLLIFDPADEVLTSRLLQARRNNPNAPEIEFLPNPNFFLKDHEVRQYFTERHKHVFGEFYQWQRERFNILIGTDYKPIGGDWILDSGNPKPLPVGEQTPSFGVYGSNPFVRAAIKYIEKHFPSSRGSDDFIWPTSHDEAAAWLDDFVENRLDNYAQYAETIDTTAAWLYHSALSSSLNIGLLSPQQVVNAALKRHAKREVPLASLESFIRGILGKREFDRGLYLAKHAELKSSNPFKHQRKLTSAWYTGGLGLPPMDDLIKKLHAHAYAHNAERATIAGSLMILCEIQPDIARRWFQELFIDVYDWTLVPNLYSLSQFVDAELTEKTCIEVSDALFASSNYPKGEWSDIWDGLFWRFVEKHESAIKHHPQMRAMIKKLGTLDADRRRIISYRAEDFLNQFTVL